MEFLQYLAPEGKPVPVRCDRCPEVEEKAEDLMKLGVLFEAEVLMTGEVSMTAEKILGDGEMVTLALEIVTNGPDVPAAVDRLVNRAWKRRNDEPCL